MSVESVQLSFRDWKNPNNYNFPHQVSIEQWAWEFLRRNPEYHEDWHHYFETCATVYGFSPDDEMDDNISTLLGLACWDLNPKLEVFIPQRVDGETIEEWM